MFPPEDFFEPAGLEAGGADVLMERMKRSTGLDIEFQRAHRNARRIGGGQRRHCGDGALEALASSPP